MAKDKDYHTRLLWYKKNLYTSESPKDDGVSPVPATADVANLVSSLTDHGMHMPVIDIDYSAELIPSSTPDHFHLYLNKATTWPKYIKVLEALAEAGLIQQGYKNWSLQRGMSLLRRPGVKKEPVKAPPFDPDTIPF